MSDRLLEAPAHTGLPAAPLARLFGRFRPRGTLGLGLVLSGLILFIGFVAPFLYPPDPFAIHPAHALQGPSLAFPFGTDELGRDELALLLSGGLATLVVALPAAILAFLDRRDLRPGRRPRPGLAWTA